MARVRKVVVVATVAITFATTFLFAGDKSKADPQGRPVIKVSGPTIVAFFSMPKGQIDTDSGTNEALVDFQFYSGNLRDRLKKDGIAFHELYERSFELRQGKKTTRFRSSQDVGYYLVAPGKKPRVEYGVMTDADLLQVASEYFGNPLK